MNDHDRVWTAYYDEGVPATIDIPAISLIDLFHESIEKFGDNVCTIFNGDQKTYHEIDQLSDRVARCLISHGIEKGERVGIMLPNIPEFVITYLGILKAGGVVMALNPNYRPAEVARLSNESDMKVLFLMNSAYREIKPIQLNTTIRTLVNLGSVEKISKDDISWKDLLDEFAAGKPLTVKAVSYTHLRAHET